MKEYKKMDSEIQILIENLDLKDKKIIDVGCGVGKIAKLLSEAGASVYGIDLPEIIGKSKEYEQGKNVILKAGTAQEIPYENNFADLVLFFYSFHHIPEEYMGKAVSEARRVVKKNGLVCFLEPVSEEGTYYELSRLMNDEAEIQKKAYGFVMQAAENDFEQLSELYFYFNRGFARFEEQVNIYVTDDDRKKDIITKAKELIAGKNETIETVVFKSLCRMNIVKVGK
jgi:ubiquinone/menaquinone biosynthesis C-methylase UbiE